jgi:hypothetical protein
LLVFLTVTVNKYRSLFSIVETSMLP